MVEHSSLQAVSKVVIKEDDATIMPIDESIMFEGPSFVQSCGNCGKSPDPNRKFSYCAKCQTTYYCSRECQLAHWPQHKGVCKFRVKALEQTQKMKEAAEAEGKMFVDPKTLQVWYHKNYRAVEHAAFHVLEMYGDHSKQPTHFVLIDVQLDESDPNNADLVRFNDAMTGPLAKLSALGNIPSKPVYDAAQSGYMILLFIDMRHGINLIEFHEPPPLEPYRNGEKEPDKEWKLHTVVALNSNLKDMNE